MTDEWSQRRDQRLLALAEAAANEWERGDYEAAQRNLDAITPDRREQFRWLTDGFVLVRISREYPMVQQQPNGG